jgi:hypothetical protein
MPKSGFSLPDGILSNAFPVAFEIAHLFYGSFRSPSLCGLIIDILRINSRGRVLIEGESP